MNKHPRLVPWKSPEDLVKLRDLFFPSSELTVVQRHESYTKGIRLVNIYASRCKIPHLLQSTSFLFSILILIESHASALDDSIRLSSSMTIIRFVNGLLDPNQQSQYAIPLNVLAKKIRLPSWFVEFRHSATHDHLPSREMCEMAVRGCIDWIWTNYWCTIVISEPLEEMEDKNDDLEKIKGLKELFRQYRRIRRQDVHKFIKFGDSSPIGKEYWTCMNSIKSLVDLNEFYRIMIERLISQKLKFEQLRLLYEPMLQHLGQFDGVITGLVDCIMNKCFEYEKSLDSSMNEVEYAHAKKWVSWLIDRSQDELMMSKFVDIIGKNMDDSNIQLLKQLQGKQISNALKQKIETKIEGLQTASKPKRIQDIDDILSDLEGLKKRAKLTQNTPFNGFKRLETWEPRPFGAIYTKNTMK